VIGCRGRQRPAPDGRTGPKREFICWRLVQYGLHRQLIKELRQNRDRQAVGNLPSERSRERGAARARGEGARMVAFEDRACNVGGEIGQAQNTSKNKLVGDRRDTESNRGLGSITVATTASAS
jgi:hypothetical protein